MKKIIRTTPQTLNAPVGNYAHITKIPAGLDWYTFSGQVGVQADGTFSNDFNEQVSQMFMNIKAILEHETIDAANITKVNIWSVDPIDWRPFTNFGFRKEECTANCTNNRNIHPRYMV